ncbi:MAG: RluA family pseudouridine synthase [Balneolaceae bacterium]
MKTTGTQPDLEILFEDNHLIAVVKPNGLLSQEDITGEPDVLSLCKNYLKKEYNKPGNVYLGLLHRLDKPVSGVMLLAKTSKAASRISEQIRKRKVKKSYLAVVSGITPANGILTHYLLKDKSTNKVKIVHSEIKGAKKAELIYHTIETSQGLSLLKISLITGRAHQIRVQLSEEGFPILGDHKYGDGKFDEIALHAHIFEVEHPTLKKPIIFESKPPRNTSWAHFSKSNIL